MPVRCAACPSTTGCRSVRYTHRACWSPSGSGARTRGSGCAGPRRWRTRCARRSWWYTRRSRGSVTMPGPSRPGWPPCTSATRRCGSRSRTCSRSGWPGGSSSPTRPAGTRPGSGTRHTRWTCRTVRRRAGTRSPWPRRWVGRWRTYTSATVPARGAATSTSSPAGATNPAHSCWSRWPGTGSPGRSRWRCPPAGRPAGPSGKPTWPRRSSSPGPTWPHRPQWTLDAATPGSDRRECPLARPVCGHVRPGRAALRAEPAAAVGRGVQVDVAAALIRADAEPGAAVLAEPDRQAPDRAGQVFGRDRGAPAGHVHVPVRGVMSGDAGLHRVRLQQRVERLDRILVAPTGAELEDLAELPLRPPETRDVPVGGLLAHPALVPDQKLQVVEAGQWRVDQINGAVCVRVEVHPTNGRRNLIWT